VNQLLVIGYWLSEKVRRARRVGGLIFLLSAGLSVMAQDAVPAAPVDPVAAAPVDPVAAAFGAIRAGDLKMAELQMEQIPGPAAKLFVKACIEQARGDSKRAIETTGELIARYPNDPDWIAKGELMITALYMELGMLDAADVAARQVQMIYEGTDVEGKATALRSKIEQLKKEAESKGSIK